MFDFGVGRGTNLLLNRAISSQKIAHAWLFCGRFDCDVNFVATKFAMAVCCKGEKNPCFSCDSCRSFEQENCVDFAKLGFETDFRKISFTIDQVRELISSAFLKPVVSKFKIFLICCVENLLPGAANALLKLIEEPPKNVILLLTTKNKFKVLPTIVSRCFCVHVSGIGKTKCLEILQNKFKDVSLKVLEKAVQFGDGYLEMSTQFVQNSVYRTAIDVSSSIFKAYVEKNELQFLKFIARLDTDLNLIFLVFDCFCCLLKKFLNENISKGLRFINEVSRVFGCFERARFAILSNCNLNLVLTQLCCSVFSG